MRFARLTAFLLTSLPARLVPCLLVLAMLYRGVVPAGYMVTPADGGAHALMVTLCVTGGATVAVPAGIDIPADAPASDDGTLPECPFAVLAAHFLMPGASTTPGIAVDRPRVLAFAAYRPAPALPAQGPPLGSRAPPSRLV